MIYMLKKIVAFSLTVVFAVSLMGGAAFAAAPKVTPDVIGVIDSRLIVPKHPAFEETNKKIQEMMRQKENETRTAIEQETDQAKKSQIMQTKQMEAFREGEGMMDPIYKDCQEAVRVIAKQRNVTIVLEKASVYIGGQDITDYVIQQLNKK